MSDRLIGRLNQTNQQIVTRLTPTNQRVVGDLNIYTMATGDGREIELAVVEEYICWRRVNDVNWIQLIPLTALKGDAPEKGIDYWTSEDQQSILDYVNSSVGGQIPHDNLLARDAADQHPISAITGLEERLSEMISDKNYIHRQSVASDTWIVIHNLDKHPSVTVVDSANTSVVGDVEYIDSNTLRIKFIGAFAGKAYIN